MTSTLSKDDFIEIKYTGYANDKIFDSNIEEDLKKIDPKAKPKKTIVAIGQEMVVKGLDSAFIGKEIGKQYEVALSLEESFGERRRDLVKTIPLKAFTEKQVNPRPGMILNLDNVMARIITISGARVITDFNNPLSGKEIKYKFTIIRKVTEEKEKVTALFEVFLRFIPEFEINDKIIVKGPKSLELFIKSLNDKFKELIGKDLVLEEMKKDDLEKKLEDKEKTK